MTYAKPYSGIPFLSNARATILMEQTRARAEEKGDDRLVQEATVALADLARWREITHAWIAQNRSKARLGGEASEIDAEADYICGCIHGNLVRLTKRRLHTEAGREAAKVILDHFTDARGNSGVGVITAVVCEEQLPRMRALYADLSAQPERARLLRIADWVDDLGDILEPYAAALQATERVTWGEVLARRNAAYDSLFAVVGLIFAHHRGDPATLGHLLAPLDDQLARAAAYARRKRAGQPAPVNEDELTPEELLAMEEVDDLDGDGVPDDVAADQPAPAQPEAQPEGGAGAQPEGGANAQPDAGAQPEADAQPDADAQPPIRRPLPS